MSVKGLAQHRLIAKAIGNMVTEMGRVLTDADRADCERLRTRADLAIARLKKRKLARAARREGRA